MIREDAFARCHSDSYVEFYANHGQSFRLHLSHSPTSLSVRRGPESPTPKNSPATFGHPILPTSRP